MFGFMKKIVQREPDREKEWRAGRGVRCQECHQIELPGEARHHCTNPLPPVVVSVEWH